MNRPYSKFLSILLSLACLVLAGLPIMAATYQVGNVVSDFTLYARRPFTNAQGQVVPAGAPVKLTDFNGKIVFLEFFYIW